MSKIRIKNFGPIRNGRIDNDGWIEIKKVTLFIGNQGSGKSTIAKLISTFTWFEKALTRGDYDKKAFEEKDVLKRYLEYHKIDNYLVFQKSKGKDQLNLYDITEIEYVGESYSFTYSNRHMKITENDNSNYPLPQIMYVPADRNFLSSIEDRKTQRIVSPALRELLDEMDKAQREIKEDLQLPINNAQLEYDKQKDILNLKGDGYSIKLSESSSGFQSFVPLFLVTRYLANIINRQSEKAEPMNSDELKRFKEGVAEIYANPTFTNDQRRAALSALSAIFNKSAFVNIVEEPEQNLFPSSQWKMLKSLLEFNNVNSGNKLIMTTHSPYIINFLSISIQAEYLRNKILKTKTSQELLPKLYKIVPEASLIAATDVVVYQLDEKLGNIRKLKTVDGIPSDKNYLNEMLAEGNHLFDQLLELEQEI